MKQAVVIVTLSLICMISALSQPLLRTIGEMQLIVIDTSGKKVELNSLIPEDKVLVINFWATWCAPCRKEIPNLANIFREENKLGLSVIGLCTESYDKNREKVIEFIKNYNVPYPIYFANKEIYYNLTETPSGSPVYLPRLLLYNKHGILSYKFEKWHGTKSKNELREAVKQLLGENL